MTDNHREGGHGDMLPLSGGGNEQLEEICRWPFVAKLIQGGKLAKCEMNSNQSTHCSNTEFPSLFGFAEGRRERSLSFCRPHTTCLLASYNIE